MRIKEQETCITLQDHDDDDDDDYDDDDDDDDDGDLNRSHDEEQKFEAKSEDTHRSSECVCSLHRR